MYILATLDKDTVKSVISGHSKRRPKLVLKTDSLLNAGQKYCRMLQGEHSAILLTFIKLLFVIKIFVLSIFEWRLKIGFTVCDILSWVRNSYLTHVIIPRGPFIGCIGSLEFTHMDIKWHHRVILYLRL